MILKMIKIIIDNREKQLYTNIKERDLDIYKDKIEINIEQLDIGDIHIYFSYNNNDYLYIYERKTSTDLISSIKDGRYKEQKIRLRASNATSINYIIEGDIITSIKNKNNQKMLTSAYLHTIYRDKINVFFTNNIDDTITFLLLLSSKIIDKPENFININNDNTINYIDNCKIKTEKNKNIDKCTCYLLQLSQIPSISKEIAKNISSVYPSLNSLLQALNESDNKIELLMKINKIGKTKATTIINYLL
jgi:crossover junction endonuclease MUS81